MILELGGRLRWLRQQKKLTQTQVALRLHLSKTTISGYENNVKCPSLDVLTQLALFYKVSADYLLGLENRPVLTLEGLSEGQKEALALLVEEIRSKELVQTT